MIEGTHEQPNYNPFREEFEAGPFTNKPTIQPHEEAAVVTAREVAEQLGLSEADTEAFIVAHIKERRWAERVRRATQREMVEHLLAKQRAIPTQYRTRAMSYREAAKYLGRPNPDSGVKWLKKCITDGIISCETLSPRAHVFDCRQFPPNVQGSILPR
jgi:hypothetical protein